MKQSVLVGAGVGAILLAMAVAGQQAAAHHAFAAEFDDKADVLLKGKVTKVEWINPHAWVHVNATSATTEKGTVKPAPGAWMVEGGTPNTLIRNGLSKASLKAGTEVIIRGYWAKDKRCAPACKANGRDITYPDGTKVFMGSSGTGAPRDGSDASER